MDNQEKYSEKSQRVDFEISKLMKQAGFDKPVIACWYEYQQLELEPDFKYSAFEYNYNCEISTFSAPLISIALEWVKELGYELDMIVQYLTLRLNGLDISTSDDYYFSPIEDKRECDLLFLKTALTHHLNNK